MKVIWMTGLPCSGKTTLGLAVTGALRSHGKSAELLDGDIIRAELWPELSFSRHDRDENVRRFGLMAGFLARNNIYAVVSVVSPYRLSRDLIRRREQGRFVEVYVNAPVNICEQRDVKGMYKRARAGEIAHFTGIDDPYEPPLNPEVECHTDVESIEQSVRKIVAQCGIAPAQMYSPFSWRDMVPEQFMSGEGI